MRPVSPDSLGARRDSGGWCPYTARTAVIAPLAGRTRKADTADVTRKTPAANTAGAENAKTELGRRANKP